MLTHLLIAGALLAGGDRDQTPQRVQRPVAKIAAKTADLNGFTSWQLQPCSKLDADEWSCTVVYDGVAAVTYRVGPELTRKRRGGRWVGPWRPTGRTVVTGLI